ncbi:MobH family relaxase [Orbus mooreae]|uniref:MobH family relaxase n=1 Tax=Orbus mooreae TaxID=3074107 RepID=UPI00370D460D
MFHFFKKTNSINKQPSVKIEGWHNPYFATKLLDSPLRQKLLSLIWQRVSMDRNRFERLYMKAIYQYVEIVQLLPASESHHHSYLGGMIDHGLEVINYALKLRQPYLLPIGGNPEDIPKQTEAWSAAVMYGALLHDIGKVVVDIEVQMNNGRTWYPWAENIQLPYRFSYRQKRDYSLHPSAAAVMIQRIIPEEGLTWLSTFPDLFPLFLNLCSGHHEKAGVLSEIIQKADMSSVSNNLGGDPTKALAKPVQSLMSKMIISIRYLVENELTLNGSKACDGWFDGSDLWVVSKTFTDKMKANLLQNGITEAPTDNAKIFNILKEQGIALANNEDKTIWTCKVESDSGWVAEKLTLIRIPINVAYSNVTKAPEPFKGRITVLANNEPEQQMSKQDETQSLVTTSNNTTLNTISHNDNSNQMLENYHIDVHTKQEVTLNDSVLNLFSDNSHDELNMTSTGVICSDLVMAPEDNDADSSLINSIIHNEESNTVNMMPDNTGIDKVLNQQTSLEMDNVYHHPFFVWLRSQIISRKLPVNTQTACIHTVENKVFLVTPKLFQKYCLHLNGNEDYENWRQIQLEFQAMKIHLKFSEENYNIWKCLISGKRKNNAVIKGYLIENRTLFAIDNGLPNNPHLTLIHDIELYKKL